MVARGKSEKVDISSILTKLQKDQGLSIGGLRDAIKPVTAFSTGNLVIDHLTGVGGFPRGRFTELYAPTGAGKGVTLDTPVLTPDRGFVSMEDITLGDSIVDPINDEDSVVIGVYPQPVQQVYRVTLDDGSFVLTDGEHLWEITYLRKETPGYQKKQGSLCLRCGKNKVRARNLCASCHSYCLNHGTLDSYPKMPKLGRGKRKLERVDGVKSTLEILDLIRKCENDSGVHISRLNRFDFYEKENLPLDPYLLGYILGDGCIQEGGSTALHIGDEDKEQALSILNTCLPGGTKLEYKQKIKYALIGDTRRYENTVPGIIKQLGLSGKKSWDKFVPEIYKYASFDARLAVLQGLMDTDGNGAKSSAEFSSSSRQLRDDVVWLAKSLGLKVRVGQKNTSYMYKGEKLQGRTAYRAFIAERDDVRIFRLERKLKSVRKDIWNYRRIVSIVPEGVEATQCIAVSAKSEMYVIGDFIPTHNTSLAVQSAATAQNQFITFGSDNKILFLDFEHTMLLDYAESLGVDPDHRDSSGVPSFIISQPHYMEQGFETAMQLVGSGQVKMIIMDSVAEMTTTEDVKGEFAQRTSPANRARKLKAMLLALKGLISEHDCACIFINHFNMSIPMGWGEKPKEQNPGGVSLPFHSSLRMKLIPGKRISSILEDPITKEKIKTVTAIESMATTTKNKMNYGYRTAKVRIDLGSGFSNVWSALQVLDAYGRISKVGTSYYFNARGWDKLIHEDMWKIGVSSRPGIKGDRSALKFAEEHPEWRSLIIKTAEEALQAGSSVYSYAGDVDEDGYGDMEDQEVLDVTEDPG